ncbi:MAG: AI-2E family transporter [Bacteroidetes bacterium]|nr:MAG: AI-2E family transporter [Bacteroidota bacterium]
MNYQHIARFWLPFTATMLAIALIFWLFWGLIFYILIALVISTLLHPFTDYIADIEVFSWRVPRIVAVLLSFGLLALVPFLFILLFVPLIAEQASILQKLDYHTVLSRLQSPVDGIEEFIMTNFPDDERQAGFLKQEITHNLTSFVSGLDVGKLLNYLVGFAGSILFYVVAVSFITFFFLYEKGLFRRNVLALVPNAYFEVAVNTFYKIEKLLSNYLLGILGQMVIMFAILSIGLSIMGIKYALTIAIFMAMMNIIPYLGPALGLVFATLVILSTPSAQGDFANNGYVLLQVLPIILGALMFDSLFVQPFIYSKSVKAHPLEIFFAIFVGATLAGGLGMLLAIPAYTILRVGYLELRASMQQYRVFRGS